MTTSTLPGIQFQAPYDQADVHLVTKGRSSYYLINDERYQRVTTVLNKAIPKPGLATWARDQALASVQNALLYDTPGANVTTGLSVEGDSAYIQWVENMITDARARPDKVRDEAADWGTRAHAAIAAILRGEDGHGAILETSRDLQPALEGFLAWLADEGITVLDVERTVWNDTLKVAGTCDGIGVDPSGNLVVWDIKTGKSIYPEMALQVSAYAVMLDALIPSHWLIDQNFRQIHTTRAFVIRLAHNPPTLDEMTFEAREVNNIGGHWTTFVYAYWVGRGLESKLWK